jgi:hypothetical protein
LWLRSFPREKWTITVQFSGYSYGFFFSNITVVATATGYSSCIFLQPNTLNSFHTVLHCSWLHCSENCLCCRDKLLTTPI